MNLPLAVLPQAVADDLRKKRVLLVDGSHGKRDLRAGVMRKLGMNVDCAADITEARSWWRADLYDLVLINVERGRGNRDRFCEDIRAAKPPQRMAFLVGGPEYLAHVPNADEDLFVSDVNQQTVAGDVKAALSATLSDLSQRWGILEASRRIAAVRSACTARTRAMQDRPAPARDFDGQSSKRINKSATLDELLKEEMR